MELYIKLGANVVPIPPVVQQAGSRSEFID